MQHGSIDGGEVARDVIITACLKPFFRFRGGALYYDEVERAVAARAAGAGKAPEDYARDLVVSWPDDWPIDEPDERDDFRDAMLYLVISVCSRGWEKDGGTPLRELIGRHDLTFNVAATPREGGRQLLSIAFMGMGRLN